MRTIDSRPATQTNPPARVLARLVAGCMVALLVGALLTGCGDDQEITAEEQALLDDDRYGDETFTSSNVGGEISIDDGLLSLSPAETDADAEEGTLAVSYFGDPEENRNVEVHPGTVFAIGEYRVRIIDIGEQDIALRWAKLEE